MNKFLLIILSFFSTGLSLSAESLILNYELTYVDQTIQGQDAIITLNTGLKLKWRPSNPEKELVANWICGDPVSLDFNSTNYSLFLSNANQKIMFFPTVEIVSETINCLPHIEKIEIIKDTDFTYVSVYDLHLFLSDGSHWFTLYDENHKSWNAGDYVIITSFDEESAFLYNYNKILSGDQEDTIFDLFDYVKKDDLDALLT